MLGAPCRSRRRDGLERVFTGVLGDVAPPAAHLVASTRRIGPLRAFPGAPARLRRAVGAVADHGSGRFDGLPGVWRRSIGAAVAAAVEDGHRRLDHLATLGRLAVVGVGDPSTVADVDGPADLDRRPG